MDIYHRKKQTENIPRSCRYLLLKTLFHFISQCTSVPYLESGGTSFVELLCFLFCLVFAMSLCASVYMCFVVTCWEKADLLALVCGVCCEFVTFPLVSWVRCGT